MVEDVEWWMSKKGNDEWLKGEMNGGRWIKIWMGEDEWFMNDWSRETSSDWEEIRWIVVDEDGGVMNDIDRGMMND